MLLLYLTRSSNFKLPRLLTNTHFPFVANKHLWKDLDFRPMSTFRILKVITLSMFQWCLFEVLILFLKPFVISYFLIFRRRLIYFMFTRTIFLIVLTIRKKNLSAVVIWTSSANFELNTFSNVCDYIILVQPLTSRHILSTFYLTITESKLAPHVQEFTIWVADKRTNASLSYSGFKP